MTRVRAFGRTRELKGTTAKLSDGRIYCAAGGIWWPMKLLSWIIYIGSFLCWLILLAGVAFLIRGAVQLFQSFQ